MPHHLAHWGNQLKVINSNLWRETCGKYGLKDVSKSFFFRQANFRCESDYIWMLTWDIIAAIATNNMIPLISFAMENPDLWHKLPGLQWGCKTCEGSLNEVPNFRRSQYNSFLAAAQKKISFPPCLDEKWHWNVKLTLVATGFTNHFRYLKWRYWTL